MNYFSRIKDAIEKIAKENKLNPNDPIIPKEIDYLLDDLANMLEEALKCSGTAEEKFYADLFIGFNGYLGIYGKKLSNALGKAEWEKRNALLCVRESLIDMWLAWDEYSDEEMASGKHLAFFGLLVENVKNSATYGKAFSDFFGLCNSLNVDPFKVLLALNSFEKALNEKIVNF